MKMLEEYTHAELVDIILAYNSYIMDWFDTHTEGCPVCIYEFIDNEYKEL